VASSSPKRAGLALADRVGSGQAGRDASGSADLQRDLGGAIMQSIFSALFTAGYGAALVFFLFPKRDEEEALLERYASEDS